MITLKDFMETVQYRITEGSDYGWNCYGPDAYCLDSWNGDHDGHTVSITFDTKTQEVYEAYVCDYKKQRAYRLINPDYKEEHDSEVAERDIDDTAWDCVKFVDLDVVEDFIEKARAIINDEDYDTRVQVPVDFTDEELLTYMKMAHERDMTFNEFVEMALNAAIDEIKLREQLDDRNMGLVIQDPPFPPDNFTKEEARAAVRKVRKKMKKGKL